ncbi:MAG: class I SAM-dependent methyltransferase [Candidatus Eremiobacterota bacterium]
MTPEMIALKEKLKSTWMAGDFHQIAQGYAPGAAEFIARLRLKSGSKVLDVACGTGNLSFPAARAGAEVTGVDIASNLLDKGRELARAEGLPVRFDEGDAEQLPYADGSFDVVVTMFGAMFAPRPERVAAELMRVCRPGGRIAMANWTPSGFIGQMFKATASHVPPPPGMASPVKWGDHATVRERLQGVAELSFTPRMISLKYPMPPTAVVEFFRQWYGPTQRAFATLDADQQKLLRQDLEKLWSEHNQPDDPGTHVRSEYLDVLAVR